MSWKKAMAAGSQVWGEAKRQMMILAPRSVGAAASSTTAGAHPFRHHATINASPPPQSAPPALRVCPLSQPNLPPPLRLQQFLAPSPHSRTSVNQIFLRLWRRRQRCSLGYQFGTQISKQGGIVGADLRAWWNIRFLSVMEVEFQVQICELKVGF